MTKLDWTKIESPDYGTSPKGLVLSQGSIRLFFSLLADRAIYRGAWVVGGDSPTDSEWNDIEAFVSGISTGLIDMSDIDLDGNDLILDADGDTKIDMSGGDDIFRINTAGSKAFEIDATGTITRPLQPSFHARLSAVASDKTGNGTTYKIIFNFETNDQNYDYDKTTGIFQAPVTGLYFFATSVYLSGVTSASSSFRLSFVSSNRNYWPGGGHSWNSSDSGQIFSSGGLLIDMDANDTVYVTVFVNGEGADIVDIQGHASAGYSIFSGSLIN